MKKSLVSNIFSFPTYEEKKEHSKVSYSQYTMWANCPKQWKLTYMDGHKKDESSIHLIFGTAMHEVVQEWLNVIYNDSVKSAEEMDLNTMLRDTMASEYKKAMAIYGVKFTSREQMNEFYQDGVEILNFLQKKRGEYFSTRHYKLVGIELPIYHPTDTNENVMMKGFLDLVFEDVTMNRIVIFDIKTSTNGWNKYQKADKTKTAQLVLYKKFFSKQYGYPVDNIQVKYFILKRKLYEEVMFAQSRIQEFEPAAGSVTLKQISTNFETFIKSAFNDDGSYRTDGTFPAMAGDKGKNCKYCPFKDNHDLCAKAERHKV